MKNNKGFTLVELLGVFAIMVVILLISMPAVTSMLKKSSENQYQNFLNDVYLATEAYVQSNSDEYPGLKNKNEKVYVYYSELLESNYLKSTTYDPENKELVKNQDYTVEVYLNDSLEYVYKVLKEHYVHIVYKTGNEVYFNPVTGLKCDASEAVSTTGTKTGCMKWYMLNVDPNSDKVDLILDHNTTIKVYWYSAPSNINGPIQALEQLKSDTSAWTGVPLRTDTYSLNNGVANYTIDYSEYRSRLITANEIAKITGNTKFNELTSEDIFENIFYFGTNTNFDEYQDEDWYKNDGDLPSELLQLQNKYAWLFDYTVSCLGQGCNVEDENVFGYWTATGAYTPEAMLSWNVWFVSYAGGLLYVPANSIINSEYGLGIRPVITIDKSVIN